MKTECIVDKSDSLYTAGAINTVLLDGIYLAKPPRFLDAESQE
jgi:hypothetical protein